MLSCLTVEVQALYALQIANCWDQRTCDTGIHFFIYAHKRIYKINVSRLARMKGLQVKKYLIQP